LRSTGSGSAAMRFTSPGRGQGVVLSKVVSQVKLEIGGNWAKHRFNIQIMCELFLELPDLY
jgi:hypothetical protein